MQLICFGLNHKTAPVAVREQFAIGYAPDSLHRTRQPDLLLPACSQWPQVLPRTTRYHVPLRAIGHIQQAVILEKAQEKTEGKDTHVRQGR